MNTPKVGCVNHDCDKCKKTRQILKDMEQAHLRLQKRYAELESKVGAVQKPCDMGEICAGCTPRNEDGSCPAEPVAYLFTNLQSGDTEASTDPDHKQDEREMWRREKLVRPTVTKNT